jgi:hypothetical protein
VIQIAIEEWYYVKEVIPIVKKLFFAPKAEIGWEWSAFSDHCYQKNRVCVDAVTEQGTLSCAARRLVNWRSIYLIEAVKLRWDEEEEEVFIWRDIGVFRNVHFHKWVAETRRCTGNNGV